MCYPAAALVAMGLVDSGWGAQPAAGPGDAGEADSKDGLILRQAMPLPEPPEIAPVQRGIVDHFVGTFVNDGVESWSALDLDRRIVASIKRRIYDVRATRAQLRP